MSRRFFYMTLAYHFLAFYFLAFSLSYAETCQDGRDYIETQSDYCYDYRGCFSTLDEAASAMGTYYTSGASAHVIGTVTAYLKYEYQGNGCSSYYAVYAVVNPALVDTDGDGIPDANDFYSDDNTPHLVRQIGFYTDDCTMGGTKVATLYETNRGDKYYTGTIPSEGSCYFQSIGYPWENPGGPISDDDFTGFDKTKETDVNKKDIGQYNQPDTNQDPEMQDGQAHDDGDTTDQSQSKIVDNTASTAQNTKRLGDYAQSLDKALSGVNQNMARSTQAQIDRNKLDADRKQSEVDYLNQAKDEFNGLDVSSHYDSTNFSGELTEGTDYQPAPDLEGESWFTSFISNNALKTAYDNSGFTMTGSTCTTTLTIPGLGTHTLSLCEFDEEFQTAGNLLLAFTSLTALIIIAWR